MELQRLQALAEQFVEGDRGNLVPEEKALRPGLGGMRIYEAPILGVCAPGDDYLAGLGETGLPFVPPEDWLNGARAVLSFFLPYTGRVLQANAESADIPEEWLHARIEGQEFVFALCGHLEKALAAEGFHSVIPSMDKRFRAVNRNGEEACHGSNWSERHVAYACGLGTFSLSKGLITRAGVAGRFGSLVTDCPLEPTPRPYRGLEDYCTHCGACAVNCPAGAISVERGKDHTLCSRFLDGVKARHAPYYGCGKCQVAVPCMAGIPASRRLEQVNIP